jgi:predicted DNA-binding transcriptional regulator AlpA
MTKQTAVPPPGTEALQLLNRQQVATLLGMSQWTVRDWHQKGKLPRPIKLSQRLGYRWRVVDIKILQQRLQRGRS